MDPVYALERLAGIGAYGVNFHDDDLIPFGSDDDTRAGIIERFKKGLADTGLAVTTATTNLFTHPVFKDGGFTNNDRDVRRFAIRKVMRNIDLAAELGAKVYVCWGGREGAEYGASKDVAAALDRYQEAFNLLGEYVVDRGYDLQVRDRAQAQRAARRHPAADRRARAGVHREPRPARSSSGSTPRSVTRRWPASTPPPATPRRCGTASSSTST